MFSRQKDIRTGDWIENQCYRSQENRIFEARGHEKQCCILFDLLIKFKLEDLTKFSSCTFLLSVLFFPFVTILSGFLLSIIKLILEFIF